MIIYNVIIYKPLDTTVIAHLAQRQYIPIKRINAPVKLVYASPLLH